MAKLRASAQSALIFVPHVNQAISLRIWSILRVFSFTSRFKNVGGNPSFYHGGHHRRVCCRTRHLKPTICTRLHLQTSRRKWHEECVASNSPPTCCSQLQEPTRLLAYPSAPQHLLPALLPTQSTETQVSFLAYIPPLRYCDECDRILRHVLIMCNNLAGTCSRQ